MRLVPVPTALQSEYLDSMKKYRELSNVIPHEFDAQAWTDFLRHNPDVMTPTSQSGVQASSPVDHSGIEKFHQILSAGSTPRETMSMPANPPYRPASPAQSALSTASRAQTPGDRFQTQQREQPVSRPSHPERSQSDVIRPSSSASMRDADVNASAKFNDRRDSIQSGYGSGEDSFEQQPRKRAKLYRAEAPGKSDLNIEKQPSSLRVAASTAASVRIHRPTPFNPLLSAAQGSTEEPVRPPTPISNLNMPPRRARPASSLLRESSTQSVPQYTSPYPASDDHPDPATTSPQESRYQGLFEPSFTMPSSPPVLDTGFPTRSSPVLPPMAIDQDSGFMSGGIDDLLDDELNLPLDNTASENMNRMKRNVRPAIQPANAVETTDSRTEQQLENPAKGPAGVSPDQVVEIHDDQHENVPAGENALARNPPAREGPAVPENQTEHLLKARPEQPTQSAQQAPRPPQRASRPSSRPSSRAGVRPAPKPLAPALPFQGGVEQLINALHSDTDTSETPAPQGMIEDGKSRSGAAARRLKQVKQVQLRLDKCIQSGRAPPYCKNCGAIETPTWRRAHSKEIEGGEEMANQFSKDSMFLFWQTVDKDEDGKVTKFKIYKKTVADEDQEFALVLLCNRK